MAKTTELSVGNALALSILHEAIEKTSAAEQQEIFQGIAHLCAHAARQAAQKPWPPPNLAAVKR